MPFKINFVIGDNKDNKLDGGEGTDFIFGLGGDDIIHANGGNDLVFAGHGDDTVSGGDGVDVLHGNSGDDVIAGDKGDDFIFGGEGNDRMVWNNGDGSDFMDGGSGYDTTEVNGADGAGDEFEVAAKGSNVEFQRVNLGPFKLDIKNTEELDVNGGGGDDTFKVGDLEGTDMQVVNFNGGKGNDILDGDEATRKIIADGGEGDDLLKGSSVADHLKGGKGDDVIIGNKGDDTMEGGEGDDLMIWNNGDGSDFMDGGEGYDTTQVNGADGAGDNFEVAAGGSDVEFKRTNLGQFKLDIQNTETLEVNGQAGDDTFKVGDLEGTDLETVIFNGGKGDDTLDGDEATRTIIADGGEGDDLLKGSSVADHLKGGEGDDVIIGNKGDDTMEGGEGDDRMIWNNGDGSDFMDGGAGFDTVEVNGATAAGDNFEVAAGGSDVEFKRTNLGLFQLDIQNTESLEVNGGGGDDNLKVGDLSKTDLKTVTFDAGDGDDFLDGSEATTRIEAFGGKGDDVLIGGSAQDLLEGGKGDDVLEGGAGNDELDGGAGDDVLEGGRGNDLLKGGAGDDQLEGGRGNDILKGGRGDDQLNGGRGNDVLEGGAGNDVLKGGRGNDELNGGAGNDELEGGSGNDVFIFEQGTGDDTVLNFEVGRDELDLSDFGFESFQDVLDAAEDQGDDTVIDLGNGDSVTLVGVSEADLSENDIAI